LPPGELLHQQLMFDIYDDTVSTATQTDAIRHKQPRRCRVNGRAAQTAHSEFTENHGGITKHDPQNDHTQSSNHTSSEIEFIYELLSGVAAKQNELLNNVQSFRHDLGSVG